MARLLNYCGWGFEGDGLSAEEETTLLASYSKRFGGAEFTRKALPPADVAQLPAPRVDVPAKLEAFSTSDRFERITHTYGQSFPDYVRCLRANTKTPRDFVARPQNEDQIHRVAQLGLRPKGCGDPLWRRVQRCWGCGAGRGEVRSMAQFRSTSQR